MTASRQIIGKSLTHGMTDKPVADHPAIDEKMLNIIMRPVGIRRGQPAAEPHKIKLFIYKNSRIGKAAAAEFGNTLLLGFVGFGNR